MEKGKDATKMFQKWRHRYGRYVTGTVRKSCLFNDALEGNEDGKKIIWGPDTNAMSVIWSSWATI